VGCEPKCILYCGVYFIAKKRIKDNKLYDEIVRANGK
jgi:hypothetical protein